MKTPKEIKEELAFQESEYLRLKALIKTGISQQKRDEYHRIASRHASRIQVLMWVLD